MNTENKNFNTIVNEEEKIIPKRVKTLVQYQGYLFQEYKDIKECSNEYKIQNYKIILDEKNKVTDIYLSQKHPNCNPDTNQFCLGDLENLEYNDKNKEIIKKVLETWNLLNCYFYPRRWLDYEI